jgi:hypothetical protein
MAHGTRYLDSSVPRRPQPAAHTPAPTYAEATVNGGNEPSFTGFCKAVTLAGSEKPQDADLGRRVLRKVYGAERQDVAKATVAKAAMNESSGSAGGYAVPTEFTLRLLEVLEEETFFYANANRIPMNSGVMQAPRVDRETVPAATGVSPLFGGITYSWGNELQPPETEPAFKQMELRAWDLVGYAAVSSDWLGDAGPEADDYLVRLFGRAAAWSVDYAFLQGTGAAQLMPLGILNAPAKNAVARGGANTIVSGDIANMAAGMLPAAWQNTHWACSPTALAQIVKIANFFVNGTPWDLVFFDPSLYAVGDRQQVLIDASPHALFRTNQTMFRVWLRLDGRPQLSGKVTLQDRTTVVSPYVVLT